MLRLFLGGEKSGKSAAALARLEQAAGPRLILATGRAGDLEFRRRIMAHRLERSPDIPVRETGAELPELLGPLFSSGLRSVLVDSLDFWLFHRLGTGDAVNAEAALLAGLDCVPGLGQPEGPELIIVSCEIGLGPVAATSETRAFVRTLGALNQALAARSQEVCLLVAGVPLHLKGGADDVFSQA